MSTRPHGAPRYIDGHLAELATRAEAEISDKRALADLFLHLGHWDALAPGTSLADLSAAQKRYNDRVIALAEIEDGLAIADIGCGLGGTLAWLNVRAERLALTGVNIDPRQLDVAKAHVFPCETNTLQWLEADACALPLPDASHDRVLAVECAFHFASRSRFLAEAARVLRPRGLLALADLVPTPDLSAARAENRLPAGLEAALEEALAPCPGLLHMEGTYDEMAAEAGLEPVAFEDATLATLPSYACILRGKLLDFTSLSEPVNDRAVAALAWLQVRGLVRVELRSLRKA